MPHRHLAGPAIAAVLLLGLFGCGPLTRTARYESADPTPSPTPSPTAAPSYNPDATGEVVGTNCRYDEPSQRFKYDLSINNVSRDLTFRYTVTVSFSGGDSPFSDDRFGSQQLEVTVAPGKERKLVASQGYVMTKRTYYGCTLSRPSKTLAD
jgi:hypothetical protein